MRPSHSVRIPRVFGPVTLAATLLLPFLSEPRSLISRENAPAPAMQVAQFANRCCTPYFWCALNAPVPVGQPFGCFTPQGFVPGYGC